MARVSIDLRHVTVALICAALAGCSSDDGGDDGPTAKPNSVKIIFSPMYSAFDGVQTYQVPATIDQAALDASAVDQVLVDSIKWKVDSAFASQEKYAALPGGVLFTTKKAGTTTVTVDAKTKGGLAVQGTAQLNITKAEPAEFEAGEARYNNNVAIDFGMLGMGGMPGMGGAASILSRIPKDASCANCHNNDMGLTVEHTPQQTAGYSDEELIQIFTMGAKPMGATFNSPFLKMIPAQYVTMIYTALHTWQIDPEVAKGVVLKLRSIPPATQEEVDFNRLREMFMNNQNGTAPAPGAGAAGSAP